MMGTRGMVGLLGKGLTGLTALLGGPLGLALIAGTMLLPPLITKVSEWISSSKDNTNAVKASTDIERQKLAEERRKNKGLTGEEQLILMISALQDLTNSLKSNVKPAYTVVINMDGKQVIKKIVKDTLIEETVNAAGK